jgi:hypothetical protein
VWLLTEAGLYRFLMASRNKSAKVVADWLFFQVIPAPRSTKKALLDVIQTGRGIIENEDYQVIIQNGAVKSTKKETDARSVVDSLYPELDWKDVLSRCSQSTSPEKAIADKLQTQLGGIREYPVPGGKIDLLTETEIIEVKAIEQFKQAVGQVKYYAHALNSDKHTQRVHLFAPDKDYSAFNVERIVSFVATLNVQVTFE